MQSWDISIERWRIEDCAELASFSCGCETLDNFFQHELASCAQFHYMTPYVVRFVESHEIVAVFTLANDAIIISGNEDKHDVFEGIFPPLDTEDGERFFYSQHVYPAINIGHLGVKTEWQRQGIGHFVISYVADSFIRYNIAGCQFITVDALNNSDTNGFYMDNHFEYQTNSDFTNKTRRMYFPLYQFKNVDSNTYSLQLLD